MPDGLDKIAMVAKANNLQMALRELRRAIQPLERADEPDLVQKCRRLINEVIQAAFQTLPSELYKKIVE